MKTALITGASQGLGRSLLDALTDRGVGVVGVARGRGALQEAVEAARARGGQAWAVPGDLGDRDAAARIAGEASQLAGPIDLLIHCASTLGPVPLRPLQQLSDVDFERVLQVNLLGPFRLTQLLAGSMTLRSGGTVVFVSSDAAIEPYGTWGAYGASKAAADQLARIWAAEVPEVRFLSIDPGEMDTAMHADALPDADRSVLQRPRDVAARILARLDAPTGSRLEVAA